MTSREEGGRHGVGAGLPHHLSSFTHPDEWAIHTLTLATVRGHGVEMVSHTKASRIRKAGYHYVLMERGELRGDVRK